MTPKETLSLLRDEIDAIDRELVALFERRMTLSSRIGEIKAAAQIAVLDESRERQVIENALRASSPANHAAVTALMRNIMELSKLRQSVIAAN